MENVRKIELRPLEGRDEALVLNNSNTRSFLITDLLFQVITAIDDKAPTREEVAAITIGTRDVLLARIHQQDFGDQIQSTAECPQCRELLDIDFSLKSLLASFRPRLAHGVKQHEDGWFQLDGENVRFRLPTGADIEELEHQAGLNPKQKARWLINRCVHPQEMPARLLKRIERVMWRLSPHLSQELPATCDICGSDFSVAFDLETFFFQVLKNAARKLLEEVHLLACWYHWTESTILSLPRRRRINYVETLLNDLRRDAL